MIVEYKMHKDKKGKKFIPYFIVDDYGGQFPVGDKWVGHTADDGSYIPETLIILDRAGLITRLTDLGVKKRDANVANHSYVDGIFQDTFPLLTSVEIEAVVDDFINKKPIRHSI